MPLHDEWLFTPQRFAVHQPTRTAVVSDLHLGYFEARRQGGDAIPLPGLGEILNPLGEGLRETGATRLVIAGDLFEKTFLAPLWNELIAWLKDREVELAGVVPGNHDRAWDESAGAALYPEGVLLGDWLVVHGHVPSAASKVVVGHWHPAMHYQGKLSPCYLVGPSQMVLPAYSPDAAGVNVWSQARWRGYRCLVIQGQRVLDVGAVRGGGPSPRAGPPSPQSKKSRPWQGRLRPG